MSDAVATTKPQQDAPDASAPEEAAPSRVRGRWQIPILGMGVLLLGGGIFRIASAYEQVTFDDELSRISRLQDAGALNIAHRYIVDILKEAEERPIEERAELQRQLARTIYLAQQREGSSLPVNNNAVLRSYQTARSLGATLSADDWVNLGETYRATDAVVESIAAYRKALAMGTKEPDRIRRQILEFRLARSDEWTGEMLKDLDAILDGEADASGNLHEASNRNYVWALEHKMNLLLDAGETGPARKLVEAAAERLKGSQALPRVEYLEALVLRAEGRPMDAEEVLRALRNDWTMRDTLWAQAGWLLGKLQQEDHRPDAALSFYDEVLRTFTEGAVYDACLLGRAECLAALERYDSSLEQFKALIAGGSQWKRPGRVDRTVVRTTITTIGERLLSDNRLKLGVDYMRLAMSLVSSTDTPLRATYLSRITMTMGEIARRELAAAKAKGESVRKALALFAETAESYLELAAIQPDSDDASRSKELAADYFDEAGMTERVVEVLSSFVRQYREHPRRAAALYRLGQANHALKLYRPAIDAYEEAIREYPRTPNALNSIVPMAECLLRLDGDDAKRGVEILVGIVDDRGPDMLFTPQAKEYRAASILLAEFYSRTTEEDVPGHFEKAIVRLEAALTHYPDDPLVPKLTYLLAEAYRQSGALLAKEASSLSSDAAKEDAQAESRRRLQKAIDAYADVIAMLAPFDESKLNVVERTYLKESYLYRADCLFDLGRYELAMEAYTEAAWRYDNMPASVSASLQIVQCQLRLGHKDEARAALARLKWTLAKIPASEFDTELGMSPKKYWEDMIERMTTSGLY